MSVDFESVLHELSVKVDYTHTSMSLSELRSRCEKVGNVGARMCSPDCAAQLESALRIAIEEGLSYRRQLANWVELRKMQTQEDKVRERGGRVEGDICAGDAGGDEEPRRQGPCWKVGCERGSMGMTGVQREREQEAARGGTTVIVGEHCPEAEAGGGGTKCVH